MKQTQLSLPHECEAGFTRLSPGAEEDSHKYSSASADLGSTEVEMATEFISDSNVTLVPFQRPVSWSLLLQSDLQEPFHWPPRLPSRDSVGELQPKRGNSQVYSSTIN